MDSETWAFMAHLGCNSYADHTVDKWGDSVGLQAESHSPEDYVRFDDEEWRFVTSRVAELGGNMILLALAEGLRYESHPELSAKGLEQGAAWAGAEQPGEDGHRADSQVQLLHGARHVAQGIPPHGFYAGLLPGLL